jgi:glycosyltransferase involved in cell wall biosynthesis
MTKLSWILPAFNEAESLAGALERGIAALSGFGTDFEVIVIDDGSSDRTAEIAEDIAAADSRVRVLRNERNLNYGIALWRGIEASRGEWLFHDGADLPLAPEDLAPFLALFDEADLIVAKRVDRAAHSPWRKLTSVTNNLLLRILFSPECRDLNFTQFYRRSVVMRHPPISTSPAFVTPELILRLEHGGYRVREVEVEFRHRQAGSAHFGRPKDILWTLSDMFRLRLRTWLRGWEA